MKNVNKKLLVVTIVALILAVSCVIGTVAYIAVKTDPIVNTFTSGNVSITLTETGAVAGAKSFKMIPNQDISKDPTVTVAAGSEASYVFIRVVADSKASAALTYSVDSAWTKLTGVDGVDNVWYLESADLSGNDAEAAVYSVLAGNKVTVKDLDSTALANNSGATLTFTAFAVQKAEVDTAQAAWAIAAALENPAT